MPRGRPQDEPATRPGGKGMLILAVIVAAATAAIFFYLAAQRPGLERLWGDEGTYVAMTASLARDLDLRFDEADREWAQARVPTRGATVILQRTDGGVFYSKPPLYPLIAAPAFRLFGEPGMIAVNGLVLAAGLFFAWICLRRTGDSARVSLTVVTFTSVGVVVPYAAWRMSESLQVGLALAGTALVCGALRPRGDRDEGRWQRLIDSRWAPAVGGILFGLLVSMRFSNAALVGGALLALAVARRWRAVGMAAIGAAVGLVALLAISQLALGAASPYTAERTSFNARIGYPTTDSEALQRFDERPATHRVDLGVSISTLYSAFYFLVGRHTGLLAYFPLALVLLGVIVRSRERTALALTSGVVALALFYLLYTPNNYFGGSTFLGNRYFLVAYPILLLAAPRLPSRRTLVAVLVLGLAFGGSAISSARQARDLSTTSQSHAAAGLFRLLPYESTAVEIQGHGQRFWSGDYVRFVDPWADVQRNHFVLHPDRPTAELMIATHRPRETLYFLARTRGEARQLVWTDWRTDGTLTLEPAARLGPVEIAVEPSSAWRRHSFWFGNDATYDVRLLRFGLEGTGDAAVELHYLSGGHRLRRGFERQLLDATVPERGSAGGSGLVRLRVRNASRIAWSRQDVLPVSIGYRIEASDGLVSEERRLLPAEVAAGEEIELDVEVRWPVEPGDYQLVIDLWLHPLQWFAEVAGEPLLERTVWID